MPAWRERSISKSASAPREKWKMRVLESSGHLELDLQAVWEAEHLAFPGSLRQLHQRYVGRLSLR